MKNAGFYEPEKTLDFGVIKTSPLHYSALFYEDQPGFDKLGEVCRDEMIERDLSLEVELKYGFGRYSVVSAVYLDKEGEEVESVEGVNLIEEAWDLL